MAKRKLADVYVTPSGDHEFPTPIPFWAPGHSVRFVEDYVRSCESLGQQIRVVWYDNQGLPLKTQRVSQPLKAYEPLAGSQNLSFVFAAFGRLHPSLDSYQQWRLTLQWAEMDASRREAVVKFLQESLDACDLSEQ